MRLKQLILHNYRQHRDLTLDLAAVTYLGPRFAGEMLTLESTFAARGCTLRLVGLTPRIRRLLDWNGIRKDFSGAA